MISETDFGDVVYPTRLYNTPDDPRFLFLIEQLSSMGLSAEVDDGVYHLCFDVSLSAPGSVIKAGLYS